MHGFDEFFGNLYHLNAEEDPEVPDYPSENGFPQFRERFGPRGVLHCFATDEDDATEHERWGRVGKQRIEDTGPLTQKRMETCDDEFADAAVDFIGRQHDAGDPFFCWVNFTHMHLRTHTKPESIGPGGAVAVAVPRHDDRPRPQRRPGARHHRRAGHRRGHDRDVQHRQRAAHEHLAGWRDDAVPQREEHQLGGRLPHPADGAVAGQDRRPACVQRDRPAPRLAARRSSRPPASPTWSTS